MPKLYLSFFMLYVICTNAMALGTNNYSQHIANNDQELKEIVADGVGVNLDAAIKNAAENALMQVVGTFVDAKNQLEKHTEIVDGVRSQTKSISSSIKEYSQGSIREIQVLSASNENGLTRVSASITVKVDEIHAYLNTLTQGEVKVDSGISGISTQLKIEKTKNQIEEAQKTDLIGILIDNILNPLISGLETEINVSQPILLSKYISSLGQNTPSPADIPIGNYIVIPVTISLKSGFETSMIKTLDAVSQSKGADDEYPDRARYSFFNGNFILHFLQFDKNTDDYKNPVRWYFSLILNSGDVFMKLNKNLPKVEVSFFNKENNLIQHGVFGLRGMGPCLAIVVSCLSVNNLNGYIDGYPYLFEFQSTVFNKKQFNMIVKVTTEDEIEKITVRYVN